MFDYLKGILAHATPSKAVVDVSGVGYLLHISVTTFQALPKEGEPISLYTSFVVREDSQKLFGFLSTQERDFFETLTEVSGIGPRLSISVLGHMSVEDLQLALGRGDAKSLTKIPGIGKKMADRLILELRDKMSSPPTSQAGSLVEPAAAVVADAVDALIGLGYKGAEAEKTIDAIVRDAKEPPPLTELISLALKARSL